MSQVTIDADRMMCVGGKPFFPITARHMPVGGSHQLLREVGFNAVRWAPFGMDRFEKESFDIPTDLAGLLFYAYVYNRGDLSDNSQRRSRELLSLVDAIKGHPGLLCYEQRNEPAYTFMNQSVPQGSAEGMKAGSDLIRARDGHHPIRVGHMCCNLVATLQRYNPAVDVVSCNPYCIDAPDNRRYAGTRPDGYLLDHPDRTMSCVGRYTDKMMRVADGRQVWMQLQGSANENWYSDDHTPDTRGQGIYPHQLRYPTWWEMRFMAFHAIIHGATGLEWMLVRHPIDAISFQDVKRVIGELRDLHDVLASPTLTHDLRIDYTELGFSDWDGVETLVKLHEGRPYILAANTQFDPMIAKFRHLPAAFAQCVEVVGEDREIEVGPDGLTDRFQPYEVHLYAPQ